MKIEAISQKNIVQKLNEASEHFRSTLKKMNLSLNPKDWKLVPKKISKSYIFSFTMYDAPPELAEKAIDLPAFRKPFCTGIFNGSIYGISPTFNYTITCKDLLQDVTQNDQQVLDKLISIIFERTISFEEFKKLLSEFSLNIVPHFDDLLVAVKEWIAEATFDNSTQYGKRLYKVTQYFPQFRKSPASVLYRCMAVNKDLLIKAQTKGKSLILKHRTYSSWTYSLASAKEFGEERASQYPNSVLVIFRKKFDKDSIVCDLETAGTYLEKHSNFKSSLVTKEKEIVVRNVQDNFVFKPKDIYLYATYEYSTEEGKRISWKPFKVPIK